MLADGHVVRASAESHPDLFWALRGGGGNFGVVTEFEFRLHPVGPMVNLAVFHWDVEQGAQALRHIREVAATLPHGVGMAVFGTTASYLPEEHRNKVGFGLMLVGFGTAEEHAELAATVRAGLPPQFELITPIPYVEVQKMPDAINYPGVFAYEKSIYTEELTDELIDVLVETLPDRVSPLSGTSIVYLRGAYSEVDEDATTFGGSRKPCFMVTATAICATADQLEADRVWSRSSWERMRPFASNVGGYVNLMADYEKDRVRATYGPAKFDRLARIKAVYDPGNMFHHNANIKPAGGSTTNG